MNRRIEMRIPRIVVAVAMSAGWLAVGEVARAVDGVVEISQAKVLANGGHFPFTITSRGSYRLTSNLDVTADATNPTAPQNRTAIQVNASEVTVDLNGFAIAGPVTCSGTPVTSCSPAGGSGSGVSVGGSSTNVTIRNGFIYGMGTFGVYAVSDAMQVDGIQTRDNGSAGIWFNGSTSNCASNRNGTYGFLGSGLVRDATAKGNGYAGFLIGPGVLRNSYADQNALQGAICFDCTAIGNTFLSTNAPAFYTNGGRVLLVDNVLRRASGSPTVDFVLPGYSAGYRSNVIDGAAPTVNLGVQIGTNLCNGSTNCP